MKKLHSFFACLLILALLLVSGLSPNWLPFNAAQADEKPLRIVATIFPAYDWIREILGEQAESAEITMLLDNGVDQHSYQPTASDLLTIAGCDLFVYVGGESDAWVDAMLASIPHDQMVAVNLMDALGDRVREEEVVEGMQAEAHDHDEDHGHDEEEAESDEHIWLSLKNAAVLCRSLCDTLSTIDPAHQAEYAANTERYIQRLNELDSAYQTMVDQAERKTLLFGDRFPFRYLADDYGLTYYAAFVGCSAETEASFETISFLVEKVNELSLPCVMTIEGTRHQIAETIIANTQTKDQTVLSLDSMQATTTRDVQNGATYLGIMEKNLDVLTQALKEGGASHGAAEL